MNWLRKINCRLSEICKAEEVLCDDDVLKTLVSTSGGDMRRAITSLQSCTRLQGKESKILVDYVYEVTGVVPNRWLTEFWNVCKSGDYQELDGFLNRFILEAYSASQVSNSIYHDG